MDITNLVFKITDQMPLVLCRYLLPLINYDFLNFFFALKWTISGVPTLLKCSRREWEHLSNGNFVRGNTSGDEERS